MSESINRNQMIHVATEVVVLAGLTMYFSSKNKTLLSYIEDLSQRLEAHETVIEEMKNEIAVLKNERKPNLPPKSTPKPKPSVKFNTNPTPKHKPIQKPINQKPTSPPLPKTLSPIEEEREDEAVESTNESDIDREIADELNELQTDTIELGEEEEIEEDEDLKKSQE